MRSFSLIIATSLLSACGMNKTYNISSTPSGAVVSAGNVIYGTTPFTTDLNTLLPHRQWDAKPSASRLLKFEKEGYLPGSYVIQEFGKGGNVHVELIKSTVTEDSTLKSPSSRLEELLRLKEKGLIDEKDYQQKKSEILNTL